MSLNGLIIDSSGSRVPNGQDGQPGPSRQPAPNPAPATNDTNTTEERKIEYVVSTSPTQVFSLLTLSRQPSYGYPENGRFYGTFRQGRCKYPCDEVGGPLPVARANTNLIRCTGREGQARHVPQDVLGGPKGEAPRPGPSALASRCGAIPSSRPWNGIRNLGHRYGAPNALCRNYWG